ncbi:MAG: archaetidylserine decarboxylase [Bacteroidota bacterium]|nr:archaetidylserine decarboxylase [Bacteroidota bacterium]
MRSFFQILSCRIVGFLAFLRLPPWLLKPVIKTYSRMYHVSVHLFDMNVQNYRCFNDFFIRKFKPGVRLFSGTLASPVDGTLYASGPINQQTLLQIKSQPITVPDLLTHPDKTINKYCSFYLAPGDYHRVHAPCNMTIHSVTYVPGAFYSVSPQVARKKPIFLKNERVIIHATSSSGPVYLIMIAALNVGNISLKVLNDDAFSHKQKTSITDNFPGQVNYKQGDEIGKFNFGSAVVLLTSEKVAENKTLRKIQLGTSLLS